MRLHRTAPLSEDAEPLVAETVDDPAPGAGEVLLRVAVCGVCHTELDEIEGRTPPPRFPVILGHQVVGQVVGLGGGAARFDLGDRVGVAWIYSACGDCEHCLGGFENLCAAFQATGRDADGGYAELMTVSEDFAYAIPDSLEDAAAAPLLCAGAIGYRSLMLAGIQDGQRLGLTGFGASGHLVLKMVRHLYPNTEVAVFARNAAEREFAIELGASWAGPIAAAAPHKLRAIIDTTPVWKPLVSALANLAPGGRLVINAIRKEAADLEELTRLDYAEHLWLEKEIKSVANITRAVVESFLAMAAAAKIAAEVEEYLLEEANRALRELKAGSIRGGKVLRVAHER
jgi:propanol-preferring alcohol dehydrogenase